MTQAMTKEEYQDLAPEVAEALREMGGGEVLQKARYPMLELVPKSNKAGTFVSGVFVGTSEYTGEDGKPRRIHTFKLIKTNAPITKWDRETRKAEPTKVAELELVSIFGNAMLDSTLLEYPKDTAIFIAYLGKLKGKKASYHNFRVVRPNSAK